MENVGSGKGRLLFDLVRHSADGSDCTANAMEMIPVCMQGVYVRAESQATLTSMRPSGLSMPFAGRCAKHSCCTHPSRLALKKHLQCESEVPFLKTMDYTHILVGALVVLIPPQLNLHLDL